MKLLFVLFMKMLSILGIVLITLKIIGYINFTWWLVLLPIYGPTLLFIQILGTIELTKSIIKK